MIHAQNCIIVSLPVKIPLRLAPGIGPMHNERREPTTKRPVAGSAHNDYRRVVMQSTEYKPWAELVTCLAQFRTQFWPLPQTTHHCTRWGPHSQHKCPCGITWPADQDRC